MLLFLGKRMVQGAAVMLVISLLAFSIRGELGDPLRELVGQAVSEEVRQQLREEMGLNEPFLIQYGQFLKKALGGDFGDSYFFKKPALEVIWAKFPATLELVLAAAFLIILLSVPAGVYCAIRPRAVAGAGHYDGEHYRDLHADFSNRHFFHLFVFGAAWLAAFFWTG